MLEEHSPVEELLHRLVVKIAHDYFKSLVGLILAKTNAGLASLNFSIEEPALK